jgi:hypothetical protein
MRQLRRQPPPARCQARHAAVDAALRRQITLIFLPLSSIFDERFSAFLSR